MCIGPTDPTKQSTKGMQSYRKGVSLGFHTFGLEWFSGQIYFLCGWLQVIMRSLLEFPILKNI